MRNGRFPRACLQTLLLASACLAGAVHAASDRDKPVVPKAWKAAAPLAFDPPGLDAVPGDGAGCVTVGFYILRDGSVAKARVMEGAFTRGAPKDFQQSFATAAIAAVERGAYVPAGRGPRPTPAFQWTVLGYGPQQGDGNRLVVGEWERHDSRVRNACRLEELAAWGKQHAVPVADAPNHAGKVLFPVDEPADAYWTHEGPLLPPRYPEAALQNGAEGCVMVGIMVGPDGVPSGFRIIDTQVSGPRRARKVLEEASLQAASHWRFAPGPDNPDRMPAFIQIPMDFAIDDPPGGLRCRMEPPPGTPPASAR